MSSASIREQIADFAERMVRSAPEGVRWGQMFHATRNAFPDVPKNTVVGSLHAFRLKLPSDIANPARGLYRVGTGVSAEDTNNRSSSASGKSPVIKESDFYEAFATWLRDDVQEATDASSLGGNSFGGKWGTPDVIGLYRPLVNDLLKFPVEVISAEIKTDTHQLITAFGQACAYRLFSHRVYLVIPDSASQDDLDRLDALANLTGIGLVKFDATSPDDPDFRIMTRAARHEPDYFFVNKVMPHCVAAMKLHSL